MSNLQRNSETMYIEITNNPSNIFQNTQLGFSSYMNSTSTRNLRNGMHSPYARGELSSIMTELSEDSKTIEESSNKHKERYLSLILILLYATNIIGNKCISN